MEYKNNRKATGDVMGNKVAKENYWGFKKFTAKPFRNSYKLNRRKIQRKDRKL